MNERIDMKLCGLVRFDVELKVEDFMAEKQVLGFEMLGNSGLVFNDGILLSCLDEIVLIFAELLNVYQQQVICFDIYSPIIKVLSKLPNSSIQESVDKLLGKWNVVKDTLKFRRRSLQLQTRKQLAIKTYNPKFHNDYSLDRKSYDPDRELREAKKLKNEYKQEMKSTIRELRLEAKFDTRRKIGDIKRKDGEYKKKMDRVRAGLAEQEGAMRGFEREAKKAKFKRDKAGK